MHHIPRTPPPETVGGVLHSRPSCLAWAVGIIDPMMLSPPHMPHPPTVSAKARREADRDRKRAERAARREAGAPDPRLLDAAIVDGLRDALASPDRHPGILPHASLRDVLRHALAHLRARSPADAPLQREAVHRAISKRLAPAQS